MESAPIIRQVAPHVTEFAFEARIDPAIHDRVLRLAEALKRHMAGGIEEVVIGYHSVGVRTRPEATARLTRTWPEVLAALPDSDLVTRHRSHAIPVRFDGADLGDICLHSGMSVADVVQLFCRVEYRVYMNGFLGGFPYMASTPEALRKPRRDSPRPNVKAGTLALAGEQAGIYQVDSPGGWNLLGQCLTDVGGLSLQPGDTVRFVEAQP